jgi:hypothetical protein
MADRLGLLHRMMGLPRRMKIPISIGIVRRTFAKSTKISEKITLAQYYHFFAFAYCIAKADKYIRDHAGLREIGTIVAEDVPEMRKFLRIVPRMWRYNPLTLPPGYSLRSQKGRLGILRRKPNFGFLVSAMQFILLRKVMSQSPNLPTLVHSDFVDISHSNALEFVRSILGKEPPIEDFSTETSGCLYIPI